MLLLVPLPHLTFADFENSSFQNEFLNVAETAVCPGIWASRSLQTPLRNTPYRVGYKRLSRGKMATNAVPELLVQEFTGCRNRFGSLAQAVENLFGFLAQCCRTWYKTALP